MSRPALSLIVPTRNRRDALLAKLRSLNDQNLPAHAFEVVVCDDGSSDGTQDALAATAYPFELKVLCTQGGEGPAVARNRAATRAAGKLLLMSDDDCTLAAGSLRAHLEAHEKYRRSVVVGPLRLPPELRHGALREPFEQVRPLAGRRASWINATGANSSVPTRLFWEAGGYDEAITGYGGEDPDLALRLRALGVRFRFEPRAVAFHHGRQLGDDSRDKAFAAGQAHWRLYRRYSDATVGLLLGVHPVVLALKRLLLNDGVEALARHPRFRYELEYLRGALAARRKESVHDRR
jgi:GT2 family glycosyltransferase